MKIVTRTVAIKNLKKYIGRDLMGLASSYGITTFKNGKQNKGWKGLVLERLAGLESNNKKAPNGLTFELKSVSFHTVKGKLKPKETMAITMLNQNELKQHSFFESHVWEKLKSLVFCAVNWHGKHAQKAELFEVTSLDYSEEDNLILEIKKDYDFIRNKLINEGFKSLSSRDGKWIQTRTKGAGHGSTSRAFYARTGLVKKIFETSKKQS